MSTEISIEQGNMLIAKFMGFVRGKGKYHNGMEDEGGKTTFPCWYNPKSKDKSPITHLYYHSSWDWLMPVVEKIEGLYDGSFSFFIVKDECDIATASPYKDDGEDWYAPSFVQKKGSKLISTWHSVVQFIQWYNQNKQQ